MNSRKKTPPDSQSFNSKSLFRWAVHGSGYLQFGLVVLVILVVFVRVVPLEMQKRIVNESIALRRFDNLFLYCGIYLAAIVSASSLKFAINVLQTLIGERAMFAMRTSLYNHIITLPLHFFRRTQPGFVVSSIIAELSTIGTFAGMAIAVPLTNILTLIAFAGYLLWLNPLLALATLLIYPIVIFILPILQKKTNMANKERVDMTRKVSSKVAESVTGITEIHAHGAYRRESAIFAEQVGQLKKIRTRWTLLRHGTKTANNFFVSLGPFIVFVFGGYLTIQGHLQLGALVAFLSAQEKLYDPWKELIDYYQMLQDALIRYEKTADHFALTSEIDLSDRDRHLPPLEGHLQVEHLSCATEEGQQLLKDVSFSLTPGEHLALVGFSGSGKSTLARCLAALLPCSGSVRLDGRELGHLTKSYLTGNIGFVTQHPYIFSGTVEENLLYALEAVGDHGMSHLTLDNKIEVLQNVGLFVDVLRFGLETTLPPEDKEMRRKVLHMRNNFQKNLASRYRELIEFYQVSAAPQEKPAAPAAENGYLEQLPIINNIFHGKIIATTLEEQERINQVVVQLLIEEDCLEVVTERGLRYDVGSEGMNLSGGQRQKLAIARVLLKQPKLLILDEATSALDNKSQSRIEGLRAKKWQGRVTLIAVVHRLDFIGSYDKIALMKNGMIIEFGTYNHLLAQNGAFARLVTEKAH